MHVLKVFLSRKLSYPDKDDIVVRELDDVVGESAFASLANIIFV